MAYTIEKQRDEEKEVRNLGIVLLIGSVVIALLFSLVCNNLIAHHFENTYSIKVTIQSIIEVGFPFGLFFLSLLALLILSAGVLHFRIKEMGQIDMLGRRMALSKDKKPYGDAHFAQPKEYVKNALVTDIEDAYGTILGQMGKTGTKVISTRVDEKARGNRNILVLGSSGSGKTHCVTKPAIMQCIRRRESILVTDPDGGLYRDMAGFCQDNGYIVRRLDLKNIRKSDGWDCFASIKGENYFENVQIFAQAVVSSLGNHDSDIFSDGARLLLSALCLRVLLGEDYDEKSKSIKSVYDLLQKTGGLQYLEEVVFDPTTIEMVKAEESLKAFNSFKQASEKLAGNIVIHLTTLLQNLQSTTIADVLSTPDIDLDLPGKFPCAYFCVFPDDNQTFAFVVALFFSMLLSRLVYQADNNRTGYLMTPVNFILDEFARYKIPNFEGSLQTVRKRHISIMILMQNLGQLRANYTEHTADSIIDGCATLLFLGTNDADTAEHISKRCGTTTVVVETEQHRKHESIFTLHHGYSKGIGQGTLLSPAALQELDDDVALIIFQRQNPILCNTYPHTLHPAAAFLRKIHVDEVPDFYDPQKRKARRREDNERIRRFYVTHPELSDMSKIDRSYQDQTDMAEALMEERSFVVEIKEKLHFRKEEELQYESEGEVEMLEMEEELEAVGTVQILRIARKK